MMILYVIQEFEVKEYALVSVDAHDGTIIWSAPFGQQGSI